MKLKNILTTLNDFAPLSLAQSWDNVGLLVGDPGQNITRVMLTIDLTEPVFAEAVQAQVNLIVAYHPPIWDPLKRVTPTQVDSPLVYNLIRKNIAVYSPHTALDVASGGVNDALAEILSIQNPQPLQSDAPEAAGVCKVVVFLPESDFEPVSQAMFSAGAGHIGPSGKYCQCSFRGTGTGTFKCGPKSNPTIGSPGKFEQTAELRFETIVSITDLPAVLRAMRQVHSYEEPAYDIYPLLNSAGHVGLGRFGDLAEPQSVNTLINRIKQKLKVSAVGLVGSPRTKVKRAAVGAGSCGSLLNDVIAHNCDFYLTGELSHHNALKLQRAGVTTVCVSHSNSERLMLPRLVQVLRKAHPKLTVKVSKKDRDPFTWG
ncbi:MAG: Nif3-like dinuclear metal center hexameric protein [Sedimentisphaerales bacterium]|nr:Nif3-like dinuclear metal center hexameric protein [Sedimentisphaerales bacterium]